MKGVKRVKYRWGRGVRQKSREKEEMSRKNEVDT